MQYGSQNAVLFPKHFPLLYPPNAMKPRRMDMTPGIIFRKLVQPLKEGRLPPSPLRIPIGRLLRYCLTL